MGTGALELGGEAEWAALGGPRRFAAAAPARRGDGSRGNWERSLGAGQRRAQH